MYCIVRTPFLDRSAKPAAERAVDEVIWIDDDEKRDRWVEQGLIAPIDLEQGLQSLKDWPWNGIGGRDLRPLPTKPGKWRVVACLSYWNDRPGLETTVPLWWDHVDRCIAVDGCWKGVHPEPHSTDGSTEYLWSLPGAAEGKLSMIAATEHWSDQIKKRSAYLQANSLREGDLLFIVDTDELVAGADKLRSAPEGLDVGWVLYRSTLYERTQGCPRVIRWRPELHYHGRHHWIYYKLRRLITTHQLGGPGMDHHLLPVMVDNRRGIGRTPERQRLAIAAKAAQSEAEKAAGGFEGSDSTGREPLRIVQLARFDAGMVVYRLHSAINTCTPHESIMATAQADRPYGEPRQYDLKEDRELLRQALRGADVIHCHLSYHDYYQLGVQSHAPLVIHHHGTMYRAEAEKSNREDAMSKAVRLVSNLEMMQYGEGLHYLPNPVPVQQYQRLRQQAKQQGREDHAFTIVHSPSKSEIKGTKHLQLVVAQLQQEGLPVKLQVLRDVTHALSLRAKAEADACFDSFDLGIQCSGLEAAAMGLPVLAGDDVVRGEYERWLGYVPYTFVADAAELKAVIRRMVEDREWRAAEALKVQQYVAKWHDYPAVALRYLDILDEATSWRTQLSFRVPRRQRRLIRT